MNETARVNRAIRINVVGGAVMLVFAALLVVLAVAGVLDWDGGTFVRLLFLLVSAALALLTARSMRQNRDDPAGIERRYQREAAAFGAAVIVIGIGVVVITIAVGLLSR